jgi:hypothetical protein
MVSAKKSFLIIALGLLTSLFSLAPGQARGNKVTVLGPGSSPAVTGNDRERLYSVFTDLAPDGQAKIFCACSADAGKTWSARSVVCSLEGAAQNLSVALENNGALDLTWGTAGGTGIFFARSTDQGKSWTVKALPGLGGVGLTRPALALAEDNTLYIAFLNSAGSPAQKSIFLTYSKDGGVTFSPPVQVSRGADDCDSPAAAVAEDGALHLAWLATKAGMPHADVFHGLVKNPAQGCEQIFKVSNCSEVLSGPSIACGKGERVYIVWTDSSLHHDRADVFCALVDGRNKMSTPINISSTPGMPSNPNVSADRRGRVAVVWCDTSYGREAIFATISRDNMGDVSYVNDISAFSRAEGLCHNPAVTLVGAQACAIWEQDGGQASPTDQRVKCVTLPLSHIGTGAAFDIHMKSAGKSRVQ